MAPDALSGGFADPGRQSQAVFRALLDAMARPGTTARLGQGVRPPPPLNPAAGAVLATLADEDTPVFLDARLSAQGAVADWLGFHTGAPIVSDPAEAAFAAIADPEGMPPLAAFRLGSDEYPDRSTTLVLQVDGFGGPLPLVLAGPGIARAAELRPHPLPARFAEELRGNRALFPRGVDIVLAATDAIAALPRAVRLIDAGDLPCT
ncbi:phosphonate C-P lyase system protein PhnH [Propylenella binzhouense]|uniref:Phosphonate C-P lyase system protein PhnH n=1 Tax=Propylenella binzhouense TaxID=2555902 RepID=A0A964T5U8_9HYPH|nr:phosphonate C-P lyase system protein PhnH [Propylenella binzhouense]MYZ48975.1 phosphonate C-P lyase system protein PhnH [Propylenella binzhouense]